MLNPFMAQVCGTVAARHCDKKRGSAVITWCVHWDLPSTPHHHRRRRRRRLIHRHPHRSSPPITPYYVPYHAVQLDPSQRRERCVDRVSSPVRGGGR